MALGRIRHRWLGLRRRRAIVLPARRWLRPGVYLLRSETLWARHGAEIPPHLQRTKGAQGGTGGAGPTAALMRLCAGAFVVTGPGGRRTAELVVASFDDGVVVLDGLRHRVLRTYGSGRMAREDQRRRRTFTDYVSAPEFTVLDDGAVVEEELVEGRHLMDASVADRERVVETLVGQYIALTRGAGEGGYGVTSGELDELVVSSAPAGFVAQWRQSYTAWMTESTPWVPSAIEANAKNLIVRPDGRPAPIDLGDLRLDPYFVYPLGILIAAGPEVMERFLGGMTDLALGSLVAAAGESWSGTAEQRRGLLLTRAAYAAMRDARLRGGCDREIFTSSIERRWDELRKVMEDTGQDPTAPR